MMGYEPRQTTSIIGHLNKPSIQALIHGLNRHYYSIAISYRKSELEEKMLMNLHKKGWTEGLKTADFKQHDKQNEETVKRMLDLAKAYNKAVQEEDEKTAEKFQIDQVCPPRPLLHACLAAQLRTCPAQDRVHGILDAVGTMQPLSLRSKMPKSCARTRLPLLPVRAVVRAHLLHAPVSRAVRACRLAS